MKSLIDIAKEMGIKPFGSKGYEYSPGYQSMLKAYRERQASGNFKKDDPKVNLSDEDLYIFYLLNKLRCYFEPDRESWSFTAIRHKTKTLTGAIYSRLRYDYSKKILSTEEQKERTEFRNAVSRYDNTIYPVDDPSFFYRSAFPAEKEDFQKYIQIHGKAPEIEPHASFRFTANLKFRKELIPLLDEFAKKHMGRYKFPDPSTTDRIDTLTFYVYEKGLKEPTPEMMREFSSIVQPYIETKHKDNVIGHQFGDGVSWIPEHQPVVMPHKKLEECFYPYFATNKKSAGEEYALFETMNLINVMAFNKGIVKQTQFERINLDGDTSNTPIEKSRFQKGIDLLSSVKEKPTALLKQVDILFNSPDLLNRRGWPTGKEKPVDRTDKTPLMIAVQHDSPELIAKLLSKGAKPLLDDKTNVLHSLGEVERDNTVQMTELVLKACSPEERQQLFAAKNDYGQTPIITAILEANPDVARTFLKHGAKLPDFKTAKKMLHTPVAVKMYTDFVAQITAENKRRTSGSSR